MLRDLFRWLGSIVGARWVVLVDDDGEENIRRGKCVNGKWVADRYSCGIRRVGLLDSGKVSNGAYVAGWYPYRPLAKAPKFPTYEKDN